MAKNNGSAIVIAEPLKPEIFGLFDRAKTLPANLCQNLDDRFVDRVLGDEADDLVCNLAVLEEEKRGDAADSVAHRCGCVGIDVHLHDLEFAVILIGNLIDNRSQGTTGTAPGKPKNLQVRARPTVEHLFQSWNRLLL